MRRRRNGIGVKGEQDTSHARQRAGYRVSTGYDLAGIDPGIARCLFVSAYRKKIPPVDGSVQHNPHQGAGYDHQDEWHRNFEQTSGRQSLQPFEAGGVTKTLSFVTGNEPRQASIEKKATESDDEWLNSQPGYQRAVYQPQPSCDANY